MLGRYNYTDKEMDLLLDGLVVLIDTREQENDNITNYFDKQKIKYKSKKLDFADYSFMIQKNEKLGVLRDIYFDKKIVIEKKNGLMELIGNLCEDSGSRLESEFIRSQGSKFYLMIENATYEDVVMGNYEIYRQNKSKYQAKALVSRIKTFEARYGIDFNYINAKVSGNFIYHTFKYWLRSELKKGLDYDSTMLMQGLPTPEGPEESTLL